jgi:lycopene beta-cyclase
MRAADSYDIILAGAGLSGLTFATECLRHPATRDWRILLIDRDDKTRNDRTWCFWATPDEVAELPPVIHKTWPNIDFYSPQYSQRLDTSAYQYHMVRGVDFYNWAKSQIADNQQITRVKANITDLDAAAGRIVTDTGTFEACWILNSAVAPFQMLPTVSGLYERPPISTLQKKQLPSGSIWLLQHFKGWIIEVPEPRFDPQAATLMDFRVEQHGCTHFVYVLPLTDRRALVEYTVFSPDLLPAESYSEALKFYLTQYLRLDSWSIIEEEFGVIPMTDYAFGPAQEGRMMHIGTIGGMVKGSSGYAFKRTQQRMRRFVADWAGTGAPHPALLRSTKQYRVYDSVFLRALESGAVSSQVVFSSFFSKLGGAAVFDFLDEKTTYSEDLKALSSVPTWPFMKAAFRQMPRLFGV